MDKKRLKIAFLSRYLGIVNRGAETYVLELSKRLSKNHDVDILTGTDSDSLWKMTSGKYDLVIPTNGRMQALKASIGRITGGYKTLLSIGYSLSIQLFVKCEFTITLLILKNLARFNKLFPCT